MQKKIFLIGELILDRNLFIKSIGKAVEFNSPKYQILKNTINLGGAGMVYSALKILSKRVEFFSIANSDFEKIVPSNLKKNLIFDNQYRLEKQRVWKKNKLIMQINNIKISKKAVLKFQNNLIKKLKKIRKNDIVILSDYRNGIFEKKFTKKIIKFIKSKKVNVYVDQQSTSKKPDLIKFKDSDYLVLNNNEYIKAFKTYKINNLNFKKSLKKLREKIIVNKIIIKSGKKGSIYNHDNNHVRVKALNYRKKVNTIGAGDFFLARFATSDKKEIKKRLFEANKFAYDKISNKIKQKTLISYN